MLDPYRRDLVAKSFFRVFEILCGASLVSVWFSDDMPSANKLVVVVVLVLCFLTAILIAPSKPTHKED